MLYHRPVHFLASESVLAFFLGHHERALPPMEINVKRFLLSCFRSVQQAFRSKRSQHSWVAIAALTLGATLPMTSQAVEEPSYVVERQLDAIEVRTYAPYTVAEVVVSADADQAGNRAFPILAGYIFGKNKGDRKLAMTAPVTQSAVPIKLAMTAPVTQAAVTGGYLVQFVLPRDITLANAPEPLDSRIRLREMPEKKVAVIRYSGFWSDANYNEHLAKLQAEMKQAGLQAMGEPVYSRYDAPFTPWFLRRNEIWLQIA